jgi:proline dehydrogenase
MEMMRRTLLWASTNPTLAQRLPRRRFVQRAVRRFMPGETLEDAYREAAALRDRGIPTLVTKLGENVETPEETREVVAEYVRALELGADRGLDTEVSVKPTQLGLDLDAELTRENLSTLARAAEGRGSLWIDMESTAYVDRTIDLYRALQAEHRHLGLCLQAYLRRTPDDLESLLPAGPRIRLVKGAYAEPPELAFPDKSDVDAAYLSLATRLIEHLADGGDGFLGLGTHDTAMIRPLTERARDAGLGGDRVEVEMLYGIGLAEQDRLVRENVPLRVLISYGDAWFPWYMRRLAERPANVWFVVRSLVG